MNFIYFRHHYTPAMQTETIAQFTGIIQYLGSTVRILRANDTTMIVHKDIQRFFNRQSQTQEVLIRDKTYTAVTLDDTMLMLSEVLTEEACEKFLNLIKSAQSPAKYLCKLNVNGKSVDIVVTETNTYVPIYDVPEQVPVMIGRKIRLYQLTNSDNVTEEKYVKDVKTYVDIVVEAWRKGIYVAKSVKMDALAVTKSATGFISLITFKRDGALAFIDIASTIELATALNVAPPEFTGEFVEAADAVMPAITIEDFMKWFMLADATLATKLKISLGIA